MVGVKQACRGPIAHVLSWSSVSSPLNFHLEQYDGPLDLLLDLIRKQQIDIRDIPIATITAQYFEYMEQARRKKPLMRKTDPTLGAREASTCSQEIGWGELLALGGDGHD